MEKSRMKIVYQFCVIIVIILVIYSCSPAKIYGKYRSNDEGSSNLIELKKDNSFSYEYFSRSCLFSLDRTGDWSLNADTLFLTDIYEWEDEAIIYDEYHDEEITELIRILVVDENDKPLRKAHIVYDITHSEDVTQTDSTNDAGVITFNAVELHETTFTQQVLLFVEYEDGNTDAFTMLQPKLSSNRITIKICDEPVSKFQQRVEKYLFLENKLLAFKGNSLDEGSTYLKVE